MVVLLFVPLYIFIITEGVILYFLTRMIISAIVDDGRYLFLDTVYYTDISVFSVIGVLLLAIAIGIAIYLYVRFAIRPAIKRARERKSKEKNSKFLIIIWIIGLILLLMPVIAYFVYILFVNFFLK